MYGARAVLKDVVEAYPAGKVSVHVVWLPMVPGDDLEAARKTGAIYAGHRVHQYFDAQAAIGLTYTKDVFTECAREALAALPQDHPLHADLRGWLESDPGERPLWDAVLFYPRGVEWSDRAPRPMLWSKQVGFFGEDAGEVTGVFFKKDCKQPPVDSDWHREVREAMRALERAVPQ